MSGPGRGRWGQMVVAICSVAVLLLTGYAWHNVNGLTSTITRLAGLGLGNGGDGAVDVLLVGTDSRTDAKGNPLSASELAAMHTGDDTTTNTDTILLIRIPNDGSSATAISIPRDSYVNVPGIGMSKINAAYGATKEAKREALVNAGVAADEAERQGTQAGRKALIDTVAQFTGVQVDHYAEIGLLGFVLLTNAVGGVDVCLKNPVNEPYSGANFPAGRQKLNGDQALSFVRQRHDLPRGDLDRIVRQQVFMASLTQKVLSAGTLTNPGRLSDLENAVSRSMVIDNDWDIVKFVEQLKDLSGGRVKFTTVPVVDSQGWSDDGQQSVVRVDPAAVHAFTAALLNPSLTSNSDYTVDVVNAGRTDGLAANVSNVITNKGFGRGALSTAESDKPDSAVYTQSANAAAAALAKDLGGLPVRTDPSLPDTTLKVVLTDSYSGPGSLSDAGPQPDATPSPTTPTTTNPAAAPQFAANGSGPQCVD